MVNKPSREQLDKEVELLRKDLKELGKKIEQYKPSKEELDESLMQMIKRLEEGRIILTHPHTDSRLDRGSIILGIIE